MKIRQVVAMPIIHQIPQTLPERPLPLHLEAILTISSIPASSAVVRCTFVARTATTGRLRRARLTSPTACTWIRLTSTQAQAATTSMAAGQCAASYLACSELYP